MSVNDTNLYDIDRRIAEIYDRTETQTEDVELIRRLIGGEQNLRVLEPFCGNGRILIPMALDGHEIVGLDQSEVMLDSARAKLSSLNEDVQRRVTLMQADVTKEAWPPDFDLVVLGANCFYELATPDEQERCIASAAAVLRPGGFVYVDNEHMEGELDKEWRSGVLSRFPTGICADGTSVKGSMETVWWDAPRRLVRFRRRVTMTLPDGTKTSKEWVQQKHPPSTSEVKTWLEKHGLSVEQTYGDRAGHPYADESPRAIFWAKKRAASNPGSS